LSIEQSALIDRLAAHRTIGAAPRGELEWLAAHGQLMAFAAGDTLASRSKPIDQLTIVLSGHIVIRVDRGAGPRKVLEWRAGDVSGLLPYSRMGVPPGDSVADEPGELLMVGKGDFPELIHRCPVVTATLVHVMLDRARAFVTSDLHDEKMISLGKLSAGLAHELNNPASAAARSATLLQESLAEADAAARALSAAGLTESQRQVVERAHDAALALTTGEFRSPLDLADREDAIAGWLTEHGADDATAASLAETPLTVEALDALAASLDPSLLEPALRWIAAGCTVRALAVEIERATSRIQALVAAVKRFTYMDRSPTREVADITQGLQDTLTVLGAKARGKSVDLRLEVEPGLPGVSLYGGELNQVWANLIDNALDAVRPSGHVHVTARLESGRVVVRVVDDGPGIPADVESRIFDPFFTTKPVGQGTGLGLDIARRLVRRHDGELDVESRPGRTEFRVSLPSSHTPPPPA
jgi:signal transduction histidine kinase